MHYETYDKGGISKLLDSNEYWNKDILPITKQRALSYMHNPRAEANDVLLIVAYEIDQVISYIGIIPDEIIIDNKENKIGIVSSWWVDPIKAKTGIGAILLLKAFNYYNNQIFVGPFSDQAGMIYKKLKNINQLKLSHAYEFKNNYYLKINDSRIKQIVPKVIISSLTFCMNIFLRFIQNRWLKNNLVIRNRLLCIEQDYIDNASQIFIEENSKNDLFKRDKEYFEWLINYPWVLELKTVSQIRNKYFFSNDDKKFKISILKIIHNNIIIGIIIIQQRNERLTLPYAYINNKYIKDVMTQIVVHFLKSDCKQMLLYNEHIIGQIKALYPPLVINKTTRKREYFISDDYNIKNIKDKLFHDGYGDAAFT